ncbi:hypothetical protein SAMN04488038_11551 [Solimonas aquatica]|uniref:PsiF repeat-containing protein n=2 Tax=Solimonas aquatica TaxID=489703 RepID=A0A1H9L7N8_9GAMM|nr:hypothetical protein SAMN04488038_11551 [Solimonas aquatica]
MKKMSRTYLMTFALLLSWQAMAQDEAPVAAPEAQPVVQTPPEEKICTLERNTGSNIPRKVCLTKAQRDAMRAQSQQGLRDAHLNTPAASR